MRKRILTMLLPLVLLLCSLPAGAEGDVYDLVDDALYRIVLRTEDGDVTLGSGVLFLDSSVILTAESCCAKGRLYAIGSDGEHAVRAMEKGGNSGAALLELATPSSAQPLSLASYDAATFPCLFGTDAQGNTGSVPLYQVLYGMYRGQESLVLSAEEGLTAGAFVVDEKGAVVALVVAQQMEGVGMYVALDPDNLYNALTGTSEAEQFLPLQAKWQDGFLTLSWTDGKRTGGVYILTLSGDDNSYYTTYEAECTEKSLQIAAPPGHTYYAQVQWAENEEAALFPVWKAMTTYTVPETKLTQYGFTQECYLASAPVGKEITDVLPEMTFFSADTLTAPGTARYLQVINRYDVSAEIECPMALELIAPDGQFYFEEMLYLFSPEYEQEDCFVLPLDDLFATCAEFSDGTLPEGEYRVRYSINGKIAGEYAFTMQPAGTEPPAAPAAEEQTSGFIRGLTAEMESGFINVSWPSEELPQDARVRVYFVYDGNTYYTYQDMKAGAESTFLFAVPERDVMLWAAWFTGENAPSGMPESQEEILIVPAQELTPLTLYGFTNLRCGLVPSADPAAAEKAEFLPAVPITREILSDRDTPIYFQTEDAYTVQAESSEHALAIILFTPEGLCFVNEGYYTFAPEYAASDLWLTDVSALFADYEAMARTEVWPAGEYVLLYCIDGQAAGQFAFALE